MGKTSINVEWPTGTSQIARSWCEGFVRHAPAMVHSIDEDGCIRAVSDLWLRKLGYAPHDVIGARAADFLAPASRQRAKARHERAGIFRAGYGENIEYQILRKDGTILDCLISAIVDTSGSDGPVMIAIITDVTAQKMIERQLIESEARYRSLVEDQTELVSLARPDGTLLFVNHAYSKQHDLTPDDMIGMNLFDFIPPAARVGVAEHLQKTLVSTIVCTTENQIILANGRPCWFAWSNRALRDATGSVTAIHSVGRDVDERKRADTRLTESEARYRILAEYSSDMIFQLDRNLVRQYVSPACRDILGIEPEELIGAAPLAIVHPDDVAHVRATFQDMIDGRSEQRSLTNRLRHKDGRWITIETRVRSIIHPITCEVLGILATLRDITAQKRIEEKLEEANRRLEVLAAQDGLTQIYNRRSFDEMLMREIRIAKREGTTLSLLMIDVDSFKAYNDRYGHPAGDACLRRVSAAISTSIKRPGDLAARYGGEEFVVLLPNTDTRGASAVAELIRHTVERLGVEHRSSVWQRVTVSIGVASVDKSMHDAMRTEAILKHADTALYTAKNSGRNTIVCWTEKASETI